MKSCREPYFHRSFLKHCQQLYSPQFSRPFKCTVCRVKQSDKKLFKQHACKHYYNRPRKKFRGLKIHLCIIQIFSQRSGKTITIDDLFRDGYKSVFIGAGLWKANAMHIKGETLGNVAFGIDYLANSKAFRLGDDIAVIGVGNSAMDCARTAIRNGARHVTCYARRDESCISASEYEVSYAKLEGVGFRFCKAPVEIRENGLICRDTVKGEDGKFTQVEGSETFYPHTGVIVSVSQGSESNLVKTTTGIETNQKGLLTVSEDGSTTREGVFAGGDAVMGARTVVEAVAVAKKVAESMDAYMKALPADDTTDPYADIPVFRTPTSDVLGKQEL